MAHLDNNNDNISAFSLVVSRLNAFLFCRNYELLNELLNELENE